MPKIFTAILLVCLTFAAFPQKNVRLRSVLPYPAVLSSVWGYADSSGNEYALVGWYRGLSIVEVTNPDSIRELFQIPGPASNWREVKTWNHHAYVTNETGSGLLIADLSLLPDSIEYSYWTADTLFGTAHTLFIDENGFVYLFGYNDLRKTIPSNQRGALICDLNPDPKHPVIAGRYSAQYVHDGFVRGDTLWAAQIHSGDFAVVDVSDKANPVVLATQETPSRATHNCWLSGNGKFLFTTDERSNAFIASYDVSSLGNISEIDRYQAAPGSMLIPHNTYFRDNYLINAYYKYGMNIVDAAFPDNLVEVGHYDTSPFPNSDGFNGCWGVYPFFPSGTILASDIETGLYVLTPDFKRACYLVGNVMRDDSTAAPLHDVTVEIMTTASVKKTGLLGEYRTGIGEPGIYDVRFYKDGCLPKIVTGIVLERSVVDTLNVALTCTASVSITPVISDDAVMLAALPSVFRHRTTLRYRLPLKETASLQVFDYCGRLLNSIALRDSEGEIAGGSHLPKGVYVVRLSGSSFTRQIRVVKI